jgi:peptidoglycan hydrolase-like protein with peptidoglycan-binding domain
MPTGHGIFQRAVEHVGEPYVHVRVPKDDSDYHGPWDCSEFVSWCVFQESGILYGCDNDHGHPASVKAFTGYWERDAKKLGRTIPWPEAAGISGAIVLRYPPPGGMGHIVISDGKGGTVEAKGAKFGVAKDKLSNRRWDTGILISGIEYDDAAPASVGTPPVVYHPGATGMDTRVVEEIQKRLLAAKINPGPVDGIYGPRTAAAVVLFQHHEGLVADGEVGSQTAAKLSIRLAHPATAILTTGVSATIPSTLNTGIGAPPPPPPPPPPPGTPMAALRSKLLSADPALVSVASGQITIRRTIPACLISGAAAVQEALKRLATKTQAFSLDLSVRDQGYYGPKTEAAVVAFQLTKAIGVELGVIERQTLFALDQEIVAIESPPAAPPQVSVPQAVEPVPPAPVQPLPAAPDKVLTTEERSLMTTLRERYKHDHRSVHVFQLPGRRGYFFQANMAIDVDGSPRAYAPRDDKPDALDKVANADVEGGSTTYIQGERNTKTGRSGEGPNEGYYVSATSLRFNYEEIYKTTNFLDAEKIPYIVLPKHILSAGLGDLAYVIDLRSFRATHAIWGDCGGHLICGEASICVARNLQLERLNAQNGEDESVFVYIVFPGTRVNPDEEPPHWTEDRIKEEANRHFVDWGGLDQVKALYKRIS